MKPGEFQFRWNGWNIEHVAKHGVSPVEAEQVVKNATKPFPQKRDRDKWLVIGRGTGGRFLQVIYVFDSEEYVYVIHARPLSDDEKRRYRRRIR